MPLSSSPLKITIPKPCSENWDSMSNVDKGRYCGNCKKVVYDFSAMSDQQLINYFSTNKNLCGRFDNSQLNREITPNPEQKNIRFRFNRFAAAFITFLSFKTLFAEAKTYALYSTVLKANHRISNNNEADEIIISGIITDRQGQPLENAKVIFDNKEIATTGKDGKFSYILPKEFSGVSQSKSEVHTLYFSYGDWVTMVRNYHPIMLSTNYDIVLYEKGTIAGITMGEPAFPSELGDLPSIVFRKSNATLTKDSKAILSAIASKIRSNPNAKVTLMAYPAAHTRSVHKDRLKAIRNYFIDNEGISPERILEKVQTVDGDENVIDIVSKSEY